MRDLSVELKNPGLIAGMGIHLGQRSPQPMDGIMIQQVLVPFPESNGSCVFHQGLHGTGAGLHGQRLGWWLSDCVGLHRRLGCCAGGLHRRLGWWLWLSGCAGAAQRLRRRLGWWLLVAQGLHRGCAGGWVGGCWLRRGYAGGWWLSGGCAGGCPRLRRRLKVVAALVAIGFRMGGCKESPGTCTSKSCRGYEVDIMHFSIGNAVPGRLYGGNMIDNTQGNGGDRFGHLVDLYAWNPHCRNLDGISPSGNDSSAQNDWKGAWWHDSFTTHSGFIEEDSPYASSGKKGTYCFEFSRSLRTMDRLQQDVQFTIGQSSKFSVAFWYPVDGNPWHGSGHYSVSCDWLPLDISAGSSVLSKSASGSSWDAASAFALLLSVVAFCSSVFLGYWVSKAKQVPFTPIDNL
ncbi:heme binding protein [Actinidia rufa]|uniref:Heme binding protein n=1 Tax=Actinidia rufa TaxID=165716 RepID=A0A7J0G8U5_9ERIC|nr:heme binding protein [Actinidia rufa]